MFFKTAQVLLASAALSQAAAVTLKPLSDPSSLLSRNEKREVKLKPISDPADLIEGLPRRRAAQGNEAFDPASAHSFFWGEKLAEEVYLANFTMEAPDDNEMLMPIEKFADRLKSIKCDNNSIVIEFASNECFEYANSVWNWVNEDKNNTMTLITKAGQCDPDEDRDPFSVTDIKFDRAGFKAVLAAKRLTWQEAAHDYSFVTTEHPNASKNATTQPQTQPQKRFSFNPGDWFDDAKKKAEEAKQKVEEAAKKAAEKAKELAEEAAKKTEEAAKKAAEEAKKKAEELKKEAEKLASPEIKENKDLPMVFKYDKNIFEYSKANYGMDIKAAARVQTSGDLKINVDIKVEKFELKRAKMSVSPKKFETSLLVALTAEGKLNKQIKYDLPGIEIPVTPIRLPKFLQLGPIVKGSIFFGSAALEGTATASFGGKAIFDDKAIISVDLLDKKGNTAKGWTPKFEKIAPQFSATLEGGIRAGISLSIGLEASIIDKIGVEAQIEADAPFIEATLKAEKNTLGVCGGKKTMGITFGAAAGANLHLEAGMVNKAPLFSATIFEETKQLPWNQCLAFGSENAQTSGTILTAVGKTSTASGTAKPTGTSKPAETSMGKTQATGSMTIATASNSKAASSTAPKSTVSGNPSPTKSTASSSPKANPSSVSSSSKSGSAQATTNSASRTTGLPMTNAISIPVNSTMVTSSIKPTTLVTSAAHAY